MKKLFVFFLVLSLALMLPVQSASAEEAAPTVYFTADISPEGLQSVYDALNWTPAGKLAVKVSTGEPPASNYLRAELIGPLVQSIARWCSPSAARSSSATPPTAAPAPAPTCISR